MYFYIKLTPRGGEVEMTCAFSTSLMVMRYALHGSKDDDVLRRISRSMGYVGFRGKTFLFERR